MLIGFALITVAVYLACALLFRLSVHALPLFVAFAAGSASYHADNGIAAVGDAAVGAVTSPLRKAGDGMKQSFREGSRAAITNTGGSITPGPNTPPPASPAPEAGQPAWAKAMKDKQTIAHGATIAAHTLKAGDSHGGGSSIDTSEKD